ncbi:MAG: type II toxin-antitoxin system VapC family toxin [Candidatus Rokuibacteriota bacterium]
MRQLTSRRSDRVLGLDTSAFIYQLEAHPVCAPRVGTIFREIERGHARGVTSTLTFLEVLVGPYRAGDQARRVAISGLLASFPGVSWVALDLAVAESAGSLRGRYRLRTPDAIQLATTLDAGADAFLTNDQQLSRVTEVPVLPIDEITDR